jgi:hypothetical protein
MLCEPEVPLVAPAPVVSVEGVEDCEVPAPVADGFVVDWPVVDELVPVVVLSVVLAGCE